MQKLIKLVHNGMVDQGYLPKFKNYIETILASQDPLRENYSEARLDLPGHLSFDIMEDEGKIIAFAGIYNGGRYPKGVYRIFNRLYLDPAVRSRHSTWPNFGFHNTVARQVFPMYEHAFKTIFTSRQGVNGRAILLKWVELFAPKYETEWVVSDNFVKVAPGNSKNSYQYIALNDMRSVDWTPDEVTLEEWNKLDA
jgi:hypothetical protein